MAANPNHTPPCSPFVKAYVANLTSSYTYTDSSSEPPMVAASVIMFFLAGLFFNLNLFSGISDVSAILEPKVRIFLSTALSLFLPVMSYLLSEANNTGHSNSNSPSASYVERPGRLHGPDLSLRAGMILTWMLMVELLRKKVDEIPMRGPSGWYLGILHRVGRVIWLGSLVFFNIKSPGRKALFSFLWILCATKVVQRIAFTEVGKLSYAHGKNARLLTSYMAQVLEHDHRQDAVHGGNNELLKRCKYIVMGEDKMKKEATEDGYELKGITPDKMVEEATEDGSKPAVTIVTVGKVWELAEEDPLLTSVDKDNRLKRLCLSFALFKLLRRRFEHLPATSDEEARNCRDLIMKGLCNTAGNSAATAEAMFQVLNDEANFLCEYYHSVVPVVFASPFFLLANYFLVPIVVFFLFLMIFILCGNGDVGYAFSSLRSDNVALHPTIVEIATCLVSQAPLSPQTFFSILDLSITILLFVIFFYEEIWEFLVLVLSNWFMVSLLCRYTAKPKWRESPIFRWVLRCLLWLRSKMGHAKLTLKQFSLLNIRWPRHIPLFATFSSLTVRTELVSSSVKRSLLESLLEHHRPDAPPLSNGKSALARHGLSHQLSWASASNSVSVTIFTWHVATSILEAKRGAPREAAAASRVATTLSKYCAYLVVFRPELLPDNNDMAERVLEDMKKELKRVLGCPSYYLSSQRTRVDKIMETIESTQSQQHTVEETHDSEIQVEPTAATPSDQNNALLNGARLAKSLMEEHDVQRVWKVLADVWTELIIYVAPSDDGETVKGHEDVLPEGGEFITVLWALATHIGMFRPATKGTTTGGRDPEL